MSHNDASHGEVRFDFNGDGLPDFVGFAVNQAGQPAFLVELSRSGQFELYLLSTDLGFSRLGFNSKKRAFTLSQDSGSSSFGESFEAKFRFQDGDFFLIGNYLTGDPFGYRVPEPSTDKHLHYEKIFNILPQVKLLWTWATVLQHFRKAFL
jgi:hypothetical protein